MIIYKYKDDDEYRREQYKANEEKEDRVWFREKDLIFMDEMIPFPDVKSVLCHGTRNGAELELFQSYYPDARVLGTEIAPTATKYNNTIRHDFRKPHHKLTGKFDIVFSNSLDHSNDPESTLKVWRDQLNRRGIMFIEVKVDQTPVRNNGARLSDPLEWEYEGEFKDLARSMGFKVHPRQLDTFQAEKLITVLYMLEQ
jgi:hypothetical protein